MTDPAAPPSLGDILAAGEAPPEGMTRGEFMTARMEELGRRNRDARMRNRARLAEAEQRRDAEQARTNYRQAMAPILDDFPDYAGASLGEVEEVITWAADVVAGRTRDWLVLMGTTGVGKTWQAVAAYRAVCADAGWDGRAITVPDLFRRSRPGAPRSVHLDALASADVLLLDEMRQPRTEFEQTTLDDVIALRDRGRGRVTIVTTNYRPEEIAPELGHRIASRMSRQVRPVVMTGPDRRAGGGGGAPPTLPLR